MVPSPPRPAAAAETPPAADLQHSALVRVTHWLTTLCFLALLVTGGEIVLSHPRFYWGEAGNVGMTPLFKLPLPASRHAVPTGYNFVLPDQNGWSRALHFQAAWLVVFTGCLYLLAGLLTRHFRRDLIPRRADLSWRALKPVVVDHLRFPPRTAMSTAAYNTLQRLTYLAVIFVLFPLMIWTGLAMSPGFTSAFPASVSILGGQQSARTLHFFVTLTLVLFVAVHIAMVYAAGFWTRTRAMITGHRSRPHE